MIPPWLPPFEKHPCPGEGTHRMEVLSCEMTRRTSSQRFHGRGTAECPRQSRCASQERHGSDFLTGQDDRFCRTRFSAACVGTQKTQCSSAAYLSLVFPGRLSCESSERGSTIWSRFQVSWSSAQGLARHSSHLPMYSCPWSLVQWRFLLVTCSQMEAEALKPKALPLWLRVRLDCSTRRGTFHML